MTGPWTLKFASDHLVKPTEEKADQIFKCYCTPLLPLCTTMNPSLQLSSLTILSMLYESSLLHLNLFHQLYACHHNNSSPPGTSDNWVEQTMYEMDRVSLFS